MRVSANILHDVVNSGLFDVDEDSYFSWSGCEVNIHPDCNPRLGSDVSDAKGYASLYDAQNHRESIYEFRICSQCHYFALYGE